MLPGYCLNNIAKYEKYAVNDVWTFKNRKCYTENMSIFVRRFT